MKLCIVSFKNSGAKKKISVLFPNGGVLDNATASDFYRIVLGAFNPIRLEKEFSGRILFNWNNEFDEMVSYARNGTIIAYVSDANSMVIEKQKAFFSYLDKHIKESFEGPAENSERRRLVPLKEYATSIGRSVEITRYYARNGMLDAVRNKNGQWSVWSDSPIPDDKRIGNYILLPQDLRLVLNSVDPSETEKFLSDIVIEFKHNNDEAFCERLQEYAKILSKKQLKLFGEKVNNSSFKSVRYIKCLNSFVLCPLDEQRLKAWGCRFACIHSAPDLSSFSPGDLDVFCDVRLSFEIANAIMEAMGDCVENFIGGIQIYLEKKKSSGMAVDFFFDTERKLFSKLS